MDNWITVISFTYPHEAHLVKGKLESEGIEVLVKDELTAQVNHFYSNAIDGVKLQVESSDYEEALQILVDLGYIKQPHDEPNRFLSLFDKLTSKLPLIGKSIIELRLIVVVALALVIIIVPVVLFSLPSTLDKLTEKSWCVDKIYYKGLALTPYTLGLRMDSEYDNCSETMFFGANGVVDFPGINSNSERARWELRNDSLFITKWTVDDGHNLGENLGSTEKEEVVNKSIYQGAYSLKIENDFIMMKSDSLIILGKIHNFNFRF